MPLMKESERMICRMDMEWKRGRMGRSLRGIILQGRKMEEVNKKLFIFLKGNYVWADGSKYEGEWKNNKIEGEGIYIWSDQRKYTGS